MTTFSRGLGRVIGALLALLGTTVAATAQASRPRKPAKHGLRRAQLFGAATGVALGLALRERGHGSPALSPLGATSPTLSSEAPRYFWP